MHLRLTTTVSVLLFAMVASSFVSAPPPASAAPPTSTGGSTVAVGDPDRGAPSPRVLSLGAPINVSVTTNADGFTVFATPVCTGTKTCRSWFVIPGTGIDRKDVTTTNGYFVPWPVTWEEGQTIPAGYVHTYGRDIFGIKWASKQSTPLGPITRPAATRGITARLVSQDDDTRTANVSGTATPGASIRRDRQEVAVVDASGNWSASVSGLATGTNRLTFEQWIRGSREDDASVEVTFLARDTLVGVTGETVTLAAATTTTVHGFLRATVDIGAPLSNGRVTFTAPSGTTFPIDVTRIRGQYRYAAGGDWRDFADDALVDGSVSSDRRSASFTWRAAGSQWSLPRATEVRFGIPVANPGTTAGTGELRMDAAGGTPQGSFDASARTPVAVERGDLSPATLAGPRSVAPGAINEFTGAATPGATFEVVDPSGSIMVPGGPFPVGDDGTWAFRARVPSGALEYGFAIRQTAYGRTETSDRFTVPADTFRPVTVDPTSIVAGAVNTFSGSATPGAEYRVVNISGTEIVSGGPFSIDERGRWTFQRTVSKGASEFRFALRQTVDGDVSTSPLFTFRPDTLAPVTVDTAFVTPGVQNHFSGTGQPGATFRVLNVSGTDIVPGTHRVRDDGTWAFDRVVSRGASEFRFAIEQTADGAVTSSGLFTLSARQ